MRVIAGHDRSLKLVLQQHIPTSPSQAPKHSYSRFGHIPGCGQKVKAFLQSLPSNSFGGGVTYVRMGSTFCNFELKDGDLVVNNGWFTPWISRNNQSGRIHRDGCRVVPNGKYKMLIHCALYRKDRKKPLKFHGLKIQHLYHLSKTSLTFKWVVADRR